MRAVIGGLLIAATAATWIRTHYYAVFYRAHIIGYLLFIGECPSIEQMYIWCKWHISIWCKWHTSMKERGARMSAEAQVSVLKSNLDCMCCNAPYIC